MPHALNATRVLALALGLGWSAPALAQTCPERPALAACTAAAPGPGASFAGPVLQVVDAHTVCVALGPLPSQWIEVVIGDSKADGTRGALMAAAFGKDVECIAGDKAGGAVIAVCMADGVSVGRLANSPDSRVQASDWR